MDQPLQFGLLRTPRVHFAAGSFETLPDILAGFGRHVLAVTGRASHRAGGRWDRLLAGCASRGVRVSHALIAGEPSPDRIDDLAARYRPEDVSVVLAVGGGSAIDAAKAVAAMLPIDASVMDFLETVGRGRAHPGTKKPVVAVPTTSGTGSEATNNAVLSRVGPDGFKVSLRHDDFVPDLALIDPLLLTDLPRATTIHGGLDTFTQLLESYVSTGANPLTDALAMSGMMHFASAFPAVCDRAAGDVAARAAVAYASLLSGVTLANTGLGVVHGLAAAIGGRFDAPHGALCGTLLAAATGVNLHLLKRRWPASEVVLAKYAMVGHLLSGQEPANINEGCDLLRATLDAWQDDLALPRLSAFGIAETDFDAILAATPRRRNPVDVPDEDLRNILALRL